MKKRYLNLSIIFVLALTGGFLFIPSVKVLSISSVKNPQVRYFSRDFLTQGFIISYTHSVNKGRVHDFYREVTIDDKYAASTGATNTNSQPRHPFFSHSNLELYQTLFVSYGAGIPEPGETPGAIFTVTDEGYFISNLNRKMSNLRMAVGIIANHSISAGSIFTKNSVEYYLTDYFPAQTAINLEIRRVSPANYIFHKIKKRG